MDVQTGVRTALERASTASTLLHRATDTLNKKLVDVEAALIVQGLGVAASVVIEAVEFAPQVVELSFAKRNKQWGLFVQVTDESVAGAITPIANASREHRIAAVRALPDLIAQLAVVAEAQLAAVRSATATASTILDALTDDGIPF